MSPVVAPSRTTAIPRISASCVTSTRRAARRGTSPTRYMREESPCQPSTIRVTSMLTMSPSRSGFFSGRPWQTTWLRDVQIDLR